MSVILLNKLECVIKFLLISYIHFLYFFFSNTCTLKKKSLHVVLSIYQFEIFNPGKTQILLRKNLERRNEGTHLDKNNYFLLCF